MSTLLPPAAPTPAPVGGTRRGAELLHEARERERAGCIPEAIECYESAIALAEQGEEQTVLAEALRRPAVLRHHRQTPAPALPACRRRPSAAPAPRTGVAPPAAHHT